MEFKEYVLKDIASVQTGPFGSQLHKSDYVENGTPIITVEHMGENRILHNNLPGVKKEDVERLSKYDLKKNDIVFSRVGSVDRRAIVSDKEEGWLFSGRCLRVRATSDIVNPIYLSYYFGLPSFKEHIRNIAVGATMPSINTKILSNIKVILPDIVSQNKISGILHSLDSKIWINEEIISNLEQISQTLFMRWFVDFEFPNRNGEAYKSSGGEMIESNLEKIPLNWETAKFKDISINFDRLRVPLSKMEREKRESIYPYYGAASLMDYVDDYLFEGVHVLLGEDGSVIDKRGYPVLQYIWGKFWVNNHAHVLKGDKSFTDEYIYLLLKQTNVENIVTGAVQPKINQTNLNNINVLVPTEDVLQEFSLIIGPAFTKIRSLREEVKVLEKLRDTLLPKLLSGEIELSDKTEVTKHVPIP